jgi:exonuclease SbcD
MVSGGLVGGGERPAQLLDVYGVAPQRLPAGAQYIGLNHLHRPQRVPTAAWCEYSGSPLQLDFGEREQQKRVVIVDARAGRPAEVESIPLTAGRPLLDVRGTLDDLRRRAEELRSAWLRVVVDVPAPAPGLAAVVKDLLPDALEIRQEYPAPPGSPPRPGPAASMPEVTAGGAARLAPTELLRSYYRETRRAELPEEMAQLFARLHQEALDAAQ